MLPRSPQERIGRGVTLAAIIWKDGDHLVYSFKGNSKTEVKINALLSLNMRDSDYQIDSWHKQLSRITKLTHISLEGSK